MENPIQDSDEQLAASAQKGDMASFSQLVERYQSRLIRYGRSLLFNHTDLEDVVQEVFIKAYRNLKSFDASRRFSPWLYRIAHNEFINHGQKRARGLVDYFDLELFLPNFPSHHNVEQDFDRIKLSEEVEQAIRKLDAKYREPLVLYFFDNLSYQEIADILRLPINTVGIRILRGKEKLKLLLSAPSK